MLNPILWQQATALWQEAKSREETLSREKLAEILNVSEQHARQIIYSLKYRDIIAMKPETFEVGSETVLMCGDNHIPYHDRLLMELFIDYGKSVKPDTIVLGGDVIDFYKLSSFCKDPRKKSIKSEIAETREFLARLRNEFPNTRIIYKEGNHEKRLMTYLFNNSPELVEVLDNAIPTMLHLKDYDIEYKVLPFQFGKLWVLHGHEKPGGSYNPEYITNVMWKFIHDNFIVFHFHRMQDKIFKSITDNSWTGIACAMMAGIHDLDYAILNNWTQGFVHLNFNNDGTFQFQKRNFVNGKLY